MKVHIVDQSGSQKTIECEYVHEADHGIYLMEEAGSTAEYAVGYVPFEQLDYVEPEGAGGASDSGEGSGRTSFGR